MFSTVRMSSKFNKGLALSVSLPNVLAKNISRTVWFCFTWIFFICVLYTLPHDKILKEMYVKGDECQLLSQKIM